MTIAFVGLTEVEMTRGVCVALWLITKVGGYHTMDARIPKEEIAAALGVGVASDQLMGVGAGGR